MAKYTAFPLVEILKYALLRSDPPYCSGVLEASPSNFELYYGREEARYVENMFHSLLSLSIVLTGMDIISTEQLAQAYECAVFGRGDEAVLDETYRKAGKIDSSNSKTVLDLVNTGLLDSVRLSLLPDSAETRTVCAELYKLNIHGSGAFFKLIGMGFFPGRDDI